MIEKRLNSLSKNETIFNNIKPSYNEALAKSGFKYKLNYSNNENNMAAQQNNKRKRTRKIIYFNPPFCESVQTNIGREFLNLVDRHFPNSHCYHNLFSRKTLKISYSCMHNIKSIIQSHNRRILNAFYTNKTHTAISRNTHIKHGNNINAANNIVTPRKQSQHNNFMSRYNLRNTTTYTTNVTTPSNVHVKQSNNTNATNNTETPKKRTQANATINRYNLRNTPSRIARNNKPTDPLTSNTALIDSPLCININNSLPNVNTNNNMPVAALTAVASTSTADTPLSSVNVGSGNTNNTTNTAEKTCNCKKSSICPLDGRCMVSNVVYKVVAGLNDVDKTYIGSTGTTFKQRLYQHNSTFRLSKYRLNTELSKYVWSCFDRFGSRPDLKWSILHNIGRSPTSASKICSLCNLERWEIALAEDRRNLLNRRSEITGGCPHRRNLYFPKLPPLPS